MNMMGDWDHNNLVHELLQGMEVARQLQISPHVPSSSTQESHELLIQKIIAAFEKALKFANLKVGLVGDPSQMPTRVAIPWSKLPPLSESPHSEDSNRDMRDLELSASRKRKTIPRWTKQIRVNQGMEVERSLDDGYSWRKYSQKDILGAKYPRGYYRCTNRNVQGCTATKQVQRSDEVPSVFEVNYWGEHTCTTASYVVPPSSGAQQNQEQTLSTGNDQQSLEQQSSDDLLLTTGNLDHAPHDKSFANSFNFPSASDSKTEEQVFPYTIVENNFAENFSYPSSYVLPNTSGTNILVSPSGGNSFEGFPNVESYVFETNDMVPASTSAANSPTVHVEFPFDHVQLDGQNFTFHNPRFP